MATSVNIPADYSNPQKVAPATQEDKLWGNVLLASFAAILILMTVMSFSYGLSGDEVDMNEYGKAILKYFSSFGSDQTVFNMPHEFNRDGVIQYYGGFFDLVCALVNKVSPLGEYPTRHLLNAWAGFLAILFAARIAARAFNKQAAVFCAWLMFLAPFFLGHAMNNPKDIPFAAAYIAAIFYTIRLFEKLPKPAVKDYIFLILAIGITINIRVGGILLIPYLFVFAGLTYFGKKWFQKENVDLKTWIKPLAIVAVAGYLAGSLFWPYGQKNPISNPLTALHEMSNFQVNLNQLWEGTKIFSNELPANFLIKSFLISNSYVLIIGLLLMAVFLLKARKSPAAAVIYFVIFTGVFPIFYIIYSKANVYHSWRHIMFSFPSLAIAASGGWYFLSQALEERKFKFGMAVAAVLLLEPAAFIISSFPNTVCYFNGFAGGVKGAYSNYEMDYYYNSVKQDAEYLIKEVIPKYKPTDTLVIGCNAAHLLSKYLVNYKNVRVDYVRFRERNQKQWDYSVFHIALVPDDEIKARTWLSKYTVFKAQVSDCTLSAVSKRPSYDDLKGFAFLQQNNIDSAMQHFNAYMAVDPDNVGMLNYMANIYHQLKRDDIAQKYAEQANKLLSVAE